MSTKNLEQGSPEWLAARLGRVTASRVGAALGVSPFQTAPALMRSMVSETLGNSENIDNPAMQWGRENEAKAVGVYEFLYLMDEATEETGLWTDEWEDIPVGASPDRLVGDKGLLEIKCPYRLRDENNPDALFKSIEEQPHYWHQVQMQLWLTDREWCDFFQWAPNGHKFERVHRDPEWFAGVIDTLKDFRGAYLGALSNASKGGPQEKVAISAQWAAHSEAFKLAKATADAAKKDMDEAKERLVELMTEAEIDECSGHGVSITKVLSKGKVDYKSMATDLMGDDEPGEMEEKYRKAGSTSWRVTQEKA